MAKLKAFSVTWTPTAAQDLRSIITNIAKDSPPAASSILAEIEEHASQLRSLPKRGRIVPELEAQDIRSYRELILPPWRIIFRLEARVVWVLAILDARRNLEDLLLDRFIRAQEP